VLLTTTNKDFKVKHGLVVSNGATFGDAIEIGEPTADDHATTKGYVDSSISAVSGKIEPVIVATTSNIDISTETLVGDTIDLAILQTGTRILIKDQTNASENGVYVVNASGPATRALDFNNNDDIFTGLQVYVIFGEVNGNTLWALSSYENDLGVEPLIFSFLGPIGMGESFSLVNNKIEIESFAKTFIDSEDNISLSLDILKSALTTVGDLESLAVTGEANFSGNVEISETLNVSGSSVFSGTVEVPEPTESAHAVTKDYVDNLVNQESVEITTIDDLSNYFNGYNSRFLPTYQGFPVTLQNPFNLLLTIDGIIQSVGSPDYVWQSVMPRVGFRIDNDGYIAFPEAIPVGSSFDARVLVGSATTTQTKVYPFKAMDIVLGGY
jgi:hypothetical protein